MHLDGAKEESSIFCSLRGNIIVAIGIDKSDKDLVGTVRMCNRRKGNSGLHVQAFGCLEGLVAECYDNEIISFGSSSLPTCVTLQGLVDDHYFTLLFLAD